MEGVWEVTGREYVDGSHWVHWYCWWERSDWRWKQRAGFSCMEVFTEVVGQTSASDGHGRTLEDRNRSRQRQPFENCEEEQSVGMMWLRSCVKRTAGDWFGRSTHHSFPVGRWTTEAASAAGRAAVGDCGSFLWWSPSGGKKSPGGM